MGADRRNPEILQRQRGGGPFRVAPQGGQFAKPLNGESDGVMSFVGLVASDFDGATTGNRKLFGGAQELECMGGYKTLQAPPQFDNDWSRPHRGRDSPYKTHERTFQALDGFRKNPGSDKGRVWICTFETLKDRKRKVARLGFPRFQDKEGRGETKTGPLFEAGSNTSSCRTNARV